MPANHSSQMKERKEGRQFRMQLIHKISVSASPTTSLGETTVSPVTSNLSHGSLGNEPSLCRHITNPLKVIFWMHKGCKHWVVICIHNFYPLNELKRLCRMSPNICILWCFVLTGASALLNSGADQTELSGWEEGTWLQWQKNTRLKNHFRT